MTFLNELWLPILLSGVFVFFVSSVVHMMLQTHKNDFRKMKNEDAVVEAFRSNGVEPGTYMFPNAESMKDMQTPEMQEKFKRGPVGWVTIVTPAQFHMGRNLMYWFAFTLIVGILVAYVSWHALIPGDDFLPVFRIAGTAAFMAYGVGYAHDFIWKAQSARTTMLFLLDGLIYALVTAATFGWLWPDAAVPGA